MSKNPGLGEKFNFRGSPKPGDDFYMLAVLPKENIPKFIDDNGGATNGPFKHLGTGEDKYFFLCHNQYPDESSEGDGLQDFYDRLYWSCDPDDFQYNDLEGYRNEGVARMSITSGVANLMYRSSFDGHFRSDRHMTTIFNSSQDMGKIVRGNQSLPVTFDIKNTTGSPLYALKDGSLFYSVPYSVKNSRTLYSVNSGSTFNGIEWVFRRFDDSSSGTSGRAVGTLVDPATNPNEDKIFNFVQMRGLSTQAGTDSSFFNYGSSEFFYKDAFMASDYSPSSTSFSIEDDPLLYENLQHSSSVIRLVNTSDNTKTTTVRYSSITSSVDSIKFNVGGSFQRGILGTDYNVLSGHGVCIQINKRNTTQCFTQVKADTDFSELFDIYLIPVEENAYFPGGIQARDNEIFTNDCTIYGNNNNRITPKTGTFDLQFFSHNSREPFTYAHVSTPGTITNYNPYYECESGDFLHNHFKHTDYRKIYNLLFFDLIGSLNPSYWTDTGNPQYPNIAEKFSLISTNIEQKSTFYMWDTIAESTAGYMFNYCKGNQVCGRCYGNNKEAQNICFADSLTRKYAVLSNTGNSKVNMPLTGQERANGTHSNPGNHLPTFAIVIISILVVVICISVIAVIIVKRRKWREGNPL